MATSLGIGGLLNASHYAFTIKKNAKGEFYFVYHSITGNQEPICWSEGYTTRQACEHAIATVKSGAAGAPTY